MGPAALTCSFAVKSLLNTLQVWLRCSQQLQVCLSSSRRQCCTSNDSSFLVRNNVKIVKGNTVFPFMFLQKRPGGWLHDKNLMHEKNYSDSTAGPRRDMIELMHLCATSLTQCRTRLTRGEGTDVNKRSLYLSPSSFSLCVLGKLPILSQSHRAPTLQHKLDFWKFPCHAAGWTGLNVEI